MALINHIEYLTPSAPHYRKDKLAILFGGSGFTAKKSFGEEIIQILETQNIRVLLIPGPAAVLNWRLHGYSTKFFSIFLFPFAFYSGEGKGGITENVEIALAVIKVLIEKGELEKDAELLVQGWSRGGVSAQRLTHGLLQEESTQQLTINLILHEPVIGGFPRAVWDDLKNTTVAENVSGFRVIYALDEILPYFEPIIIRAQQDKCPISELKWEGLSIEEKIKKISNEVLLVLPTTHVGLCWPNVSKENPNYQLAVLMRKLSWGLMLNDGEKNKLVELYSVLRFKQFKDSLNKIGERILKTDALLKKGKRGFLRQLRVRFRLKYEQVIGRLDLYRTAVSQDVDDNDCLKEAVTGIQKVLKNKKIRFMSGVMVAIYVYIKLLPDFIMYLIP